MIITLQIPDELYQHYAERNPSNPQSELAMALKEFAPYFPGKKRVVIEGEKLKQLSKILGHPISTADELLEHAQRSEKVTLGKGIEVELGVGQRQRLMAQAEFFKQPFEEFVKKQVSAGVVAIVGP